MNKIISRGAEAIIEKSGKLIKKIRIPKSYRLPILDDKLRKQRTKKESKLLEKAYQLISVPKVLKIDENKKEIEMDFISGKKLSLCLDSLKNKYKIAKEIGKNIAILHDSDIIHGDLTTSNMIYKDSKVFFIDFGLGFESNKVEDKAVDLHLIKQALEAKHFKNFQKLFESVKSGYFKSINAKETLNRLEAVELRGRYKKQY